MLSRGTLGGWRPCLSASQHVRSSALVPSVPRHSLFCHRACRKHALSKAHDRGPKAVTVPAAVAGQQNGEDPEDTSNYQEADHAVQPEANSADKDSSKSTNSNSSEPHLPQQHQQLHINQGPLRAAGHALLILLDFMQQQDINPAQLDSRDPLRVALETAASLLLGPGGFDYLVVQLAVDLGPQGFTQRHLEEAMHVCSAELSSDTSVKAWLFFCPPKQPSAAQVEMESHRLETLAAAESIRLQRPLFQPQPPLLPQQPQPQPPQAKLEQPLTAFSFTLVHHGTRGTPPLPRLQLHPRETAADLGSERLVQQLNAALQAVGADLDKASQANVAAASQTEEGQEQRQLTSSSGSSSCLSSAAGGSSNSSTEEEAAMVATAAAGAGEVGAAPPAATDSFNRHVQGEHQRQRRADENALVAAGRVLLQLLDFLQQQDIRPNRLEKTDPLCVVLETAVASLLGPSGGFDFLHMQENGTQSPKKFTKSSLLRVLRRMQVTSCRAQLSQDASCGDVIFSFNKFRYLQAFDMAKVAAADPRSWLHQLRQQQQAQEQTQQTIAAFSFALVRVGSGDEPPLLVFPPPAAATAAAAAGMVSQQQVKLIISMTESLQAAGFDPARAQEDRDDLLASSGSGDDSSSVPSSLTTGPLPLSGSGSSRSTRPSSTTEDSQDCDSSSSDNDSNSSSSSSDTSRAGKFHVLQTELNGSDRLAAAGQALLRLLAFVLEHGNVEKTTKVSPSFRHALERAADALLRGSNNFDYIYIQCPDNVQAQTFSSSIKAIGKIFGLGRVGVPPTVGMERAAAILHRKGSGSGGKWNKKAALLLNQWVVDPGSLLHRLQQQHHAIAETSVALVRDGSDQASELLLHYVAVSSDIVAAEAESASDEQKPSQIETVASELQQYAEALFLAAAEPQHTAESVATLPQPLQQLIMQLEDALEAAGFQAPDAAQQQKELRQPPGQSKSHRPELSGTTSSDSAAGGKDAERLSPNARLARVLSIQPPQGRAQSFDCLAGFFANGHSSEQTAQTLDADVLLGPGAKPTCVQSWLLPQLIDERQPPLLVVAPSGTGRVTATLLTVAAELAAAADVAAEEDELEEQLTPILAGEVATIATNADFQEAGQDDEEKEEGFEADEALFEDSVSSNTRIQVDNSGWSELAYPSEAALEDVLPWEQEDMVGAATDAIQSYDGCLQHHQQQQHAEPDAEADEADETYAHVDDDTETAALTVEPICTPYMLLLLPTQGAAEAAVRQHATMMAAAGVEMKLLPPLPQAVAEASQAPQSNDNAKAEAAVELELTQTEAEQKVKVERNMKWCVQQVQGLRDGLAGVDVLVATPDGLVQHVEMLFDIATAEVDIITGPGCEASTTFSEQERYGYIGFDQVMWVVVDESGLEKASSAERLMAGANATNSAALIAAAPQDGIVSSRPSTAATAAEVVTNPPIATTTGGADAEGHLPIKVTTGEGVAADDVLASIEGGAEGEAAAVPDDRSAADAIAVAEGEAHINTGAAASQDEAAACSSASAEGKAAADAADKAARAAEAAKWRAQWDFMREVALVLELLPAASFENGRGAWGPADVDMSGAARLVYLTEELPPWKRLDNDRLRRMWGPSTEDVMHLFAALNQDRAVQRLLIVPSSAPEAGQQDHATAVVAAASSRIGTPSHAPTQHVAAEGNVTCFLMPSDIGSCLHPYSQRKDTSRWKPARLSEEIRGVACSIRDLDPRDKEVQSLHELLDVFRLSKSVQQPQELRPWQKPVLLDPMQDGHQQQQQQQQGQDIELLVSFDVKRQRDRRENTGGQSNAVPGAIALQEVAEAVYPPLNTKLYHFQGKQVLVVRRDNTPMPDTRPDVNPLRPSGLEFKLPSEATSLLDEQLPQLQKQQQQLLQLAADHDMALPASLSSTTAALPAATSTGVDVADADAEDQVMSASSSSSSGGSGNGSKGGLDAQVVADQLRKRRRKPGSMGFTARQKLWQHLRDRRKWLARDADHAEMQQQRNQLPAAAARQQLSDLLDQHQVLLVTGETGCGKSTQVPQFIMEAAEADSRLHKINIVAAQPRRLITTALAGRVAEERGEQVGEVVGYSIRADKRTSQITRLTFCTTGVLIRRLMVDPELSNVTHVIIDEVHERGLEVDFLLTAMRQLAAVRPDLKLLLMSATVNAQGLMDYFSSHVAGSVGSMHIEGKTFPVDQFFLEDLLEARLRAAVAAQTAAQPNWQQQQLLQHPASAPGPTHGSMYNSSSRSVSVTGAMLGLPNDQTVAAAAAAAARLKNMPVDVSVAVGRFRPDSDYKLNMYQEKELLGYTVDDQELRQAGYSPATILELKRWAVGVTSAPAMSRDQHTQSVVAAIEFIFHHEPNPGAVLVFLPSWMSIVEVFSALSNQPDLFDRMLVYVLHSALPINEQQEVFQHTEPGIRKVILATNIAESSITFDDVIAVIDSCRVNVASFDPVKNMPCLGPQWVSQASMWQRRGRAGRVQRGMSIHLVPKKMATQHLEHYDLPEMLRLPLVDVCLMVKSLGFSDIAGFLAGAPDPPEPTAISNAIRELQGLSALNDEQELTPLGRLLALLPGDIKATRMVIYGALLGVLDPVLTLAASGVTSAGGSDCLRMPNEAMMKARGDAATESDSESKSSSNKPVWVREARSLLEDRRLELAGSEASDFAVTLAAYKEYKQIKFGTQYRYPWQQFKAMQEIMLNERTLQSIHAERLQYTQLLYRAGFLVPASGFFDPNRRGRESGALADSGGYLDDGWEGAGAAAAPPAAQATSGGAWYDLLFDEEIEQLDAELQQQIRQLQEQQQPQLQQQNATAMDWMLGEYADAAAGSHTWLTLDETDASASDMDEPASSSSAAGAAGALPAELSSRNLRKLVKQYSCNAEDYPQLLEAVVAAGLFPNFAHVQLDKQGEKVLRKLDTSKEKRSNKPDKLSSHLLRWTNAEDGYVLPSVTSVLGKRVPNFRWLAYSSKQLNTESGQVYLKSCSPVPDLAVLLFSTDLMVNAQLQLPRALHAPQQAAATIAADAVVDETAGAASDVAATAAAEAQPEQVDIPMPEPVSRVSPSEVRLLQGFATYKVEDPEGMAALVWMRHHLQLLLELAVAGKAAEVFEASQSFSQLLGKLLQLSSEATDDKDPLLRLHKHQQRMLQEEAEAEANERMLQETLSLR